LAAHVVLPPLFCLLTLGCFGQLTDEQKQQTFPPPPPGFEYELGAPSIYRGSEARHLTFPSAYRTEWEANNTVHGLLMVPTDAGGEMPLVILLHGLGVRDHVLEESIAHRLNDKGIAALVVSLPYHIERTPEGYRSGALTLTPDPDSWRATFRQAVSDVRRAVDWAEEQASIDSGKIGVLGVSLGAIIASIDASVEPRIRYAALLLGGGDVAHIIWHSSITITTRDALRRRGWTEDSLRQELADVEPLNYVTAELGERTFLIGALFDTVVPAADTAKLHQTLGSPPMLWLETNHYGAILVQRRVFGLVAEFFEKRFAGEEFVPPSSIHAPTIRIGLTLDAERGVQVAAGVDLWRSNRKGEFYASGMLSTRGLSLFAGWRGPLGFSPGVFALPDRTVFGLLWHFIL
jgi:hypothetical protein